MATEQTPTSSRTIARIAVRSTVWVGLGTYLNQGIGFVSMLVMTRLLSPEVFGFFSMAIFWMTLLNLRTKSGLNYAAIRQPTSDGDLMGTYWVLDSLAAAGSLGLSVAAAFALSRFGYRSEVTLGLVVLMAADGISVIVSPLSMILEKELQVSRLTLVSLLASIVAYGVAIYLAVTGAGIWSLIAVNAVSSLASLIGVYWLCRQRWPHAFKWRWRFNRTKSDQLLREGLPTGLSLTALSSIVTQFDNFLIGTFVGYATLGFYDRAYRIASWPNLLLTMIVSRIGFLTFAKVQNDPPRLTHAVRLSLWVLTTLGIPLALFLFFGASDIVQILYGGKWSQSAFFLRFLTI
jgi:O-antigen/teichoic acid export membrane protein